MFRRLLAAAMLTLAVCAAVPAWAADPVQSSLPLTANGQTYNECIYSDGTRFYVCHLLYGWTGTAPKPWTMDASGYGGVNIQNTPAVTISGTPTFNLGGTLPGFASPPTFNIGTGGPSGYALEAGHLATIDSATSAGWTQSHADLGAILAKQPAAPALESGHLAAIDTSTAAAAATAGAKSDAGSTATDTTPVSQMSALKGQIIELKAIVTALGNTLNVNCSGCSGTGLGGVANATGATLTEGQSVPTFSFDLASRIRTTTTILGTLPAFASTPTFNIGSGGPVGYSLDATVQATNTDLGAPGSTACTTDTGSCALNALLQRNNQRLTSLIAALGSPLQAGGAVTTADYRPTSATISAVDTATTTVAGQNSVTLVTGTPTANSFLTWALNGYSSATVTVPSTFTGTAQIELSADGGVTYGPASAKIMGSGGTTASITAPGVFRVDVTGMTNVRVRATALSAGTLTAQLAASASPGLTQVINPVRLADSTGNSYTATNPVPVASTSTFASSSALETSHVIKGGAGNLLSFEVAPDATLMATTWYLLVFNSSTVPSSGAVAPAKCYGPIPANTPLLGAQFNGGLSFTSGISFAVSSTGCFSYTPAGAHAFISGDFQ